jgi:hypothetical protein
MNEFFQEINDNDSSDGDNGEDEQSNYLNEMTQDVIEWDESKNTDLCQMYRSPQPPPGTSCSSSRGTTKRKTRSSSNGKKKRTPTSASSTNSSLFWDVKRQLDPLCRNGITSVNNNSSSSNNNNNNNNNTDNINININDHSKKVRIEKAETEINGILDVLNMEGGTGTTSSTLNNGNDNNNARTQYAFLASPLSTNSSVPTPKRHNNNKKLAKGEFRRHHTHPKTHNNQNNQQLKSSSTSLALRHRRRRTTEYTTDNEQFGRQQRKEQSINVITSTTTSASTTVFTTPAINNLNNDTDNRNIKSTTSSAQHDDFAVLLDAITTPNNTSTEIQLPRSPVVSVDENTTMSTMKDGKEESKDNSPCTKKLKDSFTDAARKSENDIDLNCSMKNNIISPQLPVASTFQSNSAQSQIQPNDSNKHDSDTNNRVCGRGNDNTNDESRNNDDEFDDIKFSEDDIAAIDSLTLSQSNIICQSTTSFCQNNNLGEDTKDQFF